MDSSGSQEKKAIPRFASFKPRPPPTEQLSRREQVEKEETSRHRSKHRSRHRSRRHDRSRSRGHRRENLEKYDSRTETRRYEESASECAPQSTNPVKEPLEDIKDLYEVDRKGDKYNLIYGTIHRYSVPHYYRIGQGRVLGLPSNYRIDRESIGENEIVVKPETWRTDFSKAKSKRLLSGLDKLPTRLLRVRPTSFADDRGSVSEDFIPLKVSSLSQRHAEHAGVSDEEDDKHAYRSIHGKLKPDEGLPSDLEPMSDTDSSGEEGAREDPDSQIKQRNVELSRMVEQCPTDVDAWLQLIDHQECVLRGTTKESTSLTSAERMSLADIKLSLYEKALKKAGQVPARDGLLLGLLEEGAKLWDTKKLSSRWHSILKSNSQYISLWIRYLDFRQTGFLDFTYDRCLATFAECLNLNKATPDSPEKIRVQMYLFLRLTLFLQETGYSEYATGLWQAVLEIVFFQPPGLDFFSSQEAALSAFAEFWDSEVARIGEVSAKGWKNSRASPLDAKVFSPQFALDPKSILSSWTLCERELTLNAHLPARSLDEPEDDPYRVILASDLKKFVPLVLLPNSTYELELVDSFLYFCHLPPIITLRNVQTTGHWMGDSFLRNDMMANVYSTIHDWLPNLSVDTASTVMPPTIFPHQHFIPSLDTFFANPDTWFFSFGPWLKATSDPACNVVRDWIRKTLRSLVEAMPWNEDLAEYAIAVEFVCNTKEAKKYAKALLKKRSSSLRLYNLYALMERRTGSNGAADNVWATSISMSKNFSHDDKVDGILLWRTWMWELLEARHIAHAFHILVSMPQNSIDLKSFPGTSSHINPSPANLLKIRNYLSEAQESAFGKGKPNIITACTDCQAVLGYLTHTQDLSKSLEAYDHTIKRLASLPDSAGAFKTYTTELLHQSRAKFIYYHLRTSSLYKPSHIRAVLAESIALFPHNTIFLSLFAWNESRFRIEERVRDIIRDITTTSRSHHNNPTLPASPIPITTHLFSIYTELSRPVYAGSTLYSARAAFEKAIGEQNIPSQTTTTTTTTTTGRSSLSLWKLYILFELSRNEIQRAKDVFYRAMRACPWSKELIMLAFSHLRDDLIRDQYTSSSSPRRGEGMDFHELRRVYNVLVEKELRIHIDIEAELDRLEAKMEQKSIALGGPISMPDDADSEDEMMQM